MIVFLSLLVAMAGFLFYLLSANPKLAELGKWAFVVGLHVFLMQIDQVVTLLK